jgi:hypothetical protein
MPISAVTRCGDVGAITPPGQALLSKLVDEILQNLFPNRFGFGTTPSAA